MKLRPLGARLVIMAGATLLGCSLAGAARAAVYHCTVQGKSVYTDTPCAANAAPAQLPDLNRADPTHDPGGLVQRYDREQQRAQHARDVNDKAWLQRYHRQQARNAAIRKGLVDGEVVEGMTPDQVEQVLGVPYGVLGSRRAPRRWTYRNGRARRSVTFHNGRVSGYSHRGDDQR